MQSTKDIRCLSGNILKLIAAAAMVCDHIGVLILPRCDVLRIIGRIAFPIFAFMIAEGAKYTKNRLRYLLTMSGFTAAIQIFYYFYSGSLEMSVMVTFSISIALIYALDLFKSTLFSKSAGIWRKILTGLLFLATIVAVRFIDENVDLDYGFYGCMLPVFASLLVTPKGDAPEIFSVLDKIPLRLLTFSVGMLLLASVNSTVQYWSFMAVPLLLLYSGKRGRGRMKYFFYVFYPLHLVILQGIKMLIDML